MSANHAVLDEFLFSSESAVAGVDVGGERKGFHAVCLAGREFQVARFAEAAAVVAWCEALNVESLGVDAPCAWSSNGGSRLAERTLRVGEEPLQCFKTPTRERATKSRFYDWVFRGEALYQALQRRFKLHTSEVGESVNKGSDRVMFETFPQAVACALSGRVLKAKNKGTDRRELLQSLGLCVKPLTSQDDVDAALCAVTARLHLQSLTTAFGNDDEGWIVLPKASLAAWRLPART